MLLPFGIGAAIAAVLSPHPATRRVQLDGSRHSVRPMALRGLNLSSRSVKLAGALVGLKVVERTGSNLPVNLVALGMCFRLRDLLTDSKIRPSTSISTMDP